MSTRIEARGFTLIELMVAIALALLLTSGLIAVMLAVSKSNRATDGAARLLENARYALSTIAEDVRHAGNQFCMNYAGLDGALAEGGALHVDVTKPISVHFDATGIPYSLGESASGTRYAIDPAELVRGVECGASCGTTARLDAFRPIAARPLPPLGATSGSRSRGTDVLSLRYARGAGRAIASISGGARGDGAPATIRLAAGVAPLESSAALVADCAGAHAIRVTSAGDALTLSGNFDDDAGPPVVTTQARVFDLDRDFAPITYYVRIDETESRSGTPLLTSALVRRVGAQESVIAHGIERFDVLYHVQTSSGSTRVLDADGVAAMTAAECRNVLPDDALSPTSGCGWRSLEGVEIFLLATSIDDLDGGTVDPVLYAWTSQGARNTSGAYETPTTLPNGLPAGRKLRRQFRTYVALRGFNH